MTFQDVFGPITTRTYLIDDFDRFILDSIPYGEVEPKNVQWGAIEYDGPGIPGMRGAKPVLQWHFGGVPYPITVAIRVYYSYVRTWDGSNATITESILFGLQQPHNLTEFVRGQPIPHMNPSLTFTTRVQNIGPLGDPTNPVWASHAAILASEANRVVTAAAPVPPTPPQAPGIAAGAPATLSRFRTLIENQLPNALDTIMGRAVSIDFDGPAQNSTSFNVFPYVLTTLVNEPDKYNQLQFWYFAGKPNRVVKAMRIPLGASRQRAEVAARLPARQNDPAPQSNAQRSRRPRRDQPQEEQQALQQEQGEHGVFVGHTGGNPGGA